MDQSNVLILVFLLFFIVLMLYINGYQLPFESIIRSSRSTFTNSDYYHYLLFGVTIALGLVLSYQLTQTINKDYANHGLLIDILNKVNVLPNILKNISESLNHLISLAKSHLAAIEKVNDHIDHNQQLLKHHMDLNKQALDHKLNLILKKLNQLDRKMDRKSIP